MSLLQLMHQQSGPLTRELLRTPGSFGLGQVPQHQNPDTVTRSVCGYCATGCGLNIHLQQGQAVNLSPDTHYPVNLGMACPKGWEALSVLESPERATVPLLRDASGQQNPVDWDKAMKTFVFRLRSIQQQHGPESVAFLSTGQMVTEEMAFLGALAKFGMGLQHGDGNTRQCMATAVVAYKQAFGFDAPPYTYADFEESDVIVLVGSNLCITHPILWERVMRNPHSPQIVVIDPRLTETAMSATLHLPVAPKSDLSLFYGLAAALLQRNAVDHDFLRKSTQGFEEFASFVSDFSPDRVCQDTGLPPQQLQQLTDTVARGQRVSFWWTMGVNQSHQGVRTAQAIINVALMTGHIGRPGTGANSITGQCNAMGSRLFSNTTCLPGGRNYESESDRRRIAELLNVPPDQIPDRPSQPYHKILDGILKGEIKGLWVLCTNPAHSWINQNQCRDILERLDFLVVQDMYHSTETAQMADLLLPAAGWGEKEGTFINSERRIGVVKKVRPAPGQALADFQIFRLIAEYWGCGEQFRQWKSPAAVFELLQQCTTGQPCDISGIQGYRQLEEHGGIQWPWPAGTTAPPEQERRLFADGRFFHEDGRARFVFEAPRPLPERVDQHWPFVLLTGRGSASQWHTQTRTRQSAVLNKLAPRELFVEINPRDAVELRIQPGEEVEVVSQRGRLTAIAVLTHSVRRGQVFLPMHDHRVNQLTLATFDPYSHQPAYKACAVRVQRRR